MKLKPHQSLYVRSMGKLLRVTAVFHHNDLEVLADMVNRHCAKTDDALVAEFGPFAYTANKYDKGIKVTP